MKLKMYRKLKIQKKLTEEEILEAYKKSYETNEDTLLLNIILSLGIFRVKASFLTVIGNYNRTEKEVKIYKHNGLSYDKDEKIYYDERRAYKIAYEGYVKDINAEYFNYSVLADNGLRYKKITKVFFEKIK